MKSLKVSIITLVVIFCYNFITSIYCLSSQTFDLEIQKKSENINIDYNDRLNFYLDMKTKRFLQKMTIKEMFLLQETLNTPFRI